MGALVHFLTLLVCRLEEHLKEILPVVFRNTDSLIAHPKLNTNVALVGHLVLFELKADCLTLFAKLDCVLNQVN
jgi:hypothetical protein